MLGLIDVRTLRYYRKRHAVGARMGRSRDPRILEYDTAARQDLRERGGRTGDFSAIRSKLRGIV